MIVKHQILILVTTTPTGGLLFLRQSLTGSLIFTRIFLPYLAGTGNQYLYSNTIKDFFIKIYMENDVYES